MYREIPRTDSKVERTHNPRCNANFFEIITHSWISNLLKIGRLRDLNETDLFTTLDDQKSSTLGDKLEKIWRSELANAYSMNRKPKLLRALLRMFGAKLMLYGLMFCITEIIFNMSQPILIGELLAYFNPYHSKDTDIEYAYLCSSGIVFSIFMTIILHYYTYEEIMNETIKVRVACCSLIYRKTLCLSYNRFGETAVGQVMNLISNDINRYDYVIHHIHYLWIGPLQIMIGIYFLWQEIGVSSLIGVATFLFFIPLQGWMGKLISKFRLQTAKNTDERIRFMNEIISGIQVIKMYTWEKPFGNLIENARKVEVEQIKGAKSIRFIWISFKIIQSRFQIFITILIYVLLGNKISFRKVYVLTSFFNLLHTSMAVKFSISLLDIGELIISIKRIQSYLLLEEKDHQIQKPYLKYDKSVEQVFGQLLIADNHITNNCNDIENNKESVNSHGIVILNTFAKWADVQTNNTLENINLTLNSGSLVAIIGPVGAGKSSLIQAILKELPVLKGKISVNGVISYASQEPWIFSGTIQQNILFGSPMDQERFKQIIDICALKSDLEHLPLGDETIVGERGITLSGGQRARINLARAVYKKADIYLLDDPLSAVDVKVGKHLFEKCIRGYLKEKACILITHQVHYLSEVDHIVLMDNGNIIIEGSYQDIQASIFDFAKVLGPLKGTTIENESETNSINNDGAESRLVSSQSGSNESILSSNFKVLTQKPNEKSEYQSYKYESKNVLISYITACESTYNIFWGFFMCIVILALIVGGDFWLSFWVNQEVYTFNNPKNTFDNSTSEPHESTNLLLWLNNYHEYYVIIYALFMVALIISVIIRSAIFIKITMKASINLHNRMFNSIIRTTMFFFNTNSSGKIINRFSKDLGAVDEILPNIFLDSLQIFIFISGTVIVIGLTNMYLLIPSFIVGIIIYKLRAYFFSTSQNVNRLEASTRSTVLAHMNASLQGLTTIRAYKAEDILSQEFDKHQDLNSSASHLYTGLNLGFGFWIDIVCLFYLCIIIFSFLITDNNIYGGSVGLALTQVITLLRRIQWWVRQSTTLLCQLTSVDRVLEYTRLPQEDTLQPIKEHSPDKEWPYSGKIVFKDFNLRYSLNSPYVLKDLNIQIQSMEKIGIVGRTGAGKSSFIGALFRLALNEGKIIIDGVDIHELALKDLRSKLSIIPQEPVLFSGTMRTNLDPFAEYPDHALWKALDEVELKNVVEDLPDGLNSKMSASGSNFSVGQRQLVCLARAILQNNKILILDEATANVDPLTDKLIQNTIRNKFRLCTVLTIAHRLNTIMDSDRVLVMDFGKIIEFDHPYSLLKNTDGFFYKMVEQTGKDTAYFLHNVASESFKTFQSRKKSPNH
ncbi:multidrug resistance-associated protein 4-like [Rhopalosiphum maidis]|uniref:multidrug resistance-associated protein 4-like n=1 Tax=Rhopalosiphum maidis TaxID=43146 RepID=UPI000EFF6A80|nr:multidrug resistance-associated protein 4-like [Rhopalosiphum maidis]